MVLTVHDRIYVLTPEGEREIQLCVGDITHLPLSEKVDIILVSSFPNDYAAMRTSVIGALKYNLGINVQQLAFHHKKEDYRKTLNCWISHPLPDDKPYRQLICFEVNLKLFLKNALSLKSDPKTERAHLVQGIFRAMMPAFNNANKSVITPLLATGFQNQDHSVMMKALVEEAISWINFGLQLQLFKIVLYSKTGQLSKEIMKAAEMFQKIKLSIEKKNKRLVIKEPSITYDIFLIYCSDDEKIAKFIHEKMQKEKKFKCISLNDISETSESWQFEVHSKMIVSARVIPLLSDAYLQHPPCIDAYNIALCARRRTKRHVLAPFVLDQFEVPTYMAMVQWINCKIYNEEKISNGTETIVDQICTEKEGKAVYQTKYDVFISYSHRNLVYAKKLLECLQETNKELKVFFDYDELKTGVSWQQTLYHSLDVSRSVVALLSPDYIQSAVGSEEYNISLARHFAKTKELELISLIIEDVPDGFSHSDIKYLKGVNNYDEVCQNVASSINSWIKNDKRSDIFSPVPEPLEANILAETIRRKLFNEHYRIKNGDICYKSSNTPTLESNESYQVYVSYTVRDEKYVEFVKQSLLLNDIKMAFNSKLDTTSNLAQIEKANCIVVFLSSHYLQSQKEIEEFDVILSKQRTSKTTDKTYVVLLDDLPHLPTYCHLVAVDTSLSDSIWEECNRDLTSSNQPELSEELTKVLKGVHKKHEQISHPQALALAKVQRDVLQILGSGSYPGHHSAGVGVLQNILNMKESITEEHKVVFSESTDDDEVQASENKPHGTVDEHEEIKSSTTKENFEHGCDTASNDTPLREQKKETNTSDNKKEVNEDKTIEKEVECPQENNMYKKRSRMCCLM